MEGRTHISVRDLNVYYGQMHALRRVNVDIPEKKITAIIGPSGCGKSTLLRALNRLIETVDGVRVTGRILVDGADIYDPKADVTEVRRKMGLLSQRPYPLPMSIYDNVAYGPRIHGMHGRRNLDAVVQKHLEESGLWDEVKDRLHEPASGLSVGQQQRLCLSRGLAVEPEIILGDEPTSALDPKSSQRIEQRFLELKDDYTIVLVTHILRQARRLADHVIFLYMGELIESGPAGQVLDDPGEQMTREYVKGVIS